MRLPNDEKLEMKGKEALIELDDGQSLLVLIVERKIGLQSSVMRCCRLLCEMIAALAGSEELVGQHQISYTDRKE